jgi:hypothetical protein
LQKAQYLRYAFGGFFLMGQVARAGNKGNDDVVTDTPALPQITCNFSGGAA